MSNENNRYGDIPDDYIPQIKRPAASAGSRPKPPSAAQRRELPGAESVRRPAGASAPARPATASRTAPASRPAAQNVAQSVAQSASAPRAPQRSAPASASVRTPAGQTAEPAPTVRRSVTRAQSSAKQSGAKAASPVRDSAPARSAAVSRSASDAAEIKKQSTPETKKPTPAPKKTKALEPEVQKAHSEEPPSNGAVMSLIKALVYIILVVAVSGLLSYYVVVFANDMYAFVKNPEEVEVTIPEYATVEEIADILGDAGVVEYPDLLVLYAKLKKIDKTYEFVAGTYTVNGMMNYDELFYAFVPHKSYEVVRITIPEGYTIEEMITLFTENGIGTREGFIDVINNYPFDFEFVKALDENPNPDRIYRLEGYLYPDTYEFYKSSSEATVIYKLLKRFDKIFSSDFYARAEELGYTVDQVLTLASMIEKEARYAKDYETVSSVFHNRLGNSSFPCLESDATIMYAIQIRDGERKTSLDGEDLAYDTPYNSYMYRGLPPGAIANPGYEAITCALWPAKTKYYYFVSDNYGNTYFARTNAEHNENKAMVKRINEAGAAN